MAIALEVKQFTSLTDMINFMHKQTEGKHILEIDKVVPKCLITDFNEFMIGKTRTTLDNEPAVHIFDYRAYLAKVLSIGVDYLLQFERESVVSDIDIENGELQSVVELDNLFNDFIESLVGKEITVYLHPNCENAMQYKEAREYHSLAISEDVITCKARIHKVKAEHNRIHCEVVILDTKKYKHKVYDYFKYF